MNYSFLSRGFFRLLVLSWTCFGLSFSLFGEPGFEELRPQAVQILKTELTEAEGWVKIHAAESLLELGYLDGVKERFDEESRIHGELPEYRIGIWRVLARSANSDLERGEWTSGIQDVFLNPDAADRLHALESLGKLGVQPDEALLAAVREYATETDSPFAWWILARQEDPNAREALERLRTSEDPITRLRAAFVWSRLTPLTREEWLREGGGESIKRELADALPAVRIQACRVLGRVGSPDEASWVVPLFEDAHPDVRIYAADALLRMERRQPHEMAGLDWTVLVAYALGMLGVGWYYSRKTKTSDDFLLGGRNMKSWMVGLSLFATLLSTVSYMAYPGEVIKHGPMIFAGLVSVPLIIWVVGWFLIPAFMRVKVTSANEILDTAFGPGIRVLGSIFFLTLRLVWMAMVIHITTKAVLGPVMNLSPATYPLASALLGAITVMYTSTGGLKAVVLTDVIQTFILFLAAFLSIFLISIHFGGFSWLPTEWAPNWDPAVFWFDPDARITFAGAMTMYFFWFVCTAGSDQMAVQRYLATKDARTARNAFTTSMVANLFVSCLLALLGFALVAYFLANPHQLGDGMQVRQNADQIFPHFIISSLPVGITGLVVAALLAAAMSSLSSGLNSACTIITVDFLDRRGDPLTSEQAHIRRARRVSWILGVVIIGLSLLVDKVQGNFIELVNKVGNLLVAPLFVLFFLALFMPKTKRLAVWVGATLSVAVAVGIAFYSLLGLSFIWIMPCSLLSGVGSACLIHLALGGRLSFSK